MRHFHRVASGVPTGPLVNALVRMPELWDVNTLRTATPGSPHCEASDVWLRFQAHEALKGDLASAVLSDLMCVNYPAWSLLPTAKDIALNLMRSMEGEALGRVMVTRLRPGTRIHPHNDVGLYPRYYDRYHVALQVNPGVVFTSGGEAPQMTTGDVWWVDNLARHEVVNNSRDDRLTMIVDIRTPRSGLRQAPYEESLTQTESVMAVPNP